MNGISWLRVWLLQAADNNGGWAPADMRMPRYRITEALPEIIDSTDADTGVFYRGAKLIPDSDTWNSREELARMKTAARVKRGLPPEPCKYTPCYFVGGGER